MQQGDRNKNTMKREIQGSSASESLTVAETVASIRQSGGGPSRSVTSLCDALAGTGTRVCLISQNNSTQDDALILPESSTVQVILVHGVESKRLRFSIPMGYRSNLLQACREFNIQLIHDHGLWSFSNVFSWQVARKLGIPLVVSPRGMLEPWALANGKIKKSIALKIFQRQIIESARGLAATSMQEAENIRALGFRQPIAILPNGVKMPDLLSSSLVPDQRVGSHTALFLSRIHKKKGVLNLLNAWKQTMPPDWKLVVAGPDEDNHLDEAKALARELGLGSVCSFVGPVDGQEKTNLYRSASIFVLPTHSENFGIVVAEALAHGVPVLTTKGAPWSDLVDHNCGWWIDLGLDALVQGLKQATSTPKAELLAMGERGRCLVERKYGWHGIGLSMRSYYEWLLFEGQKPDFVI